jgi:hypothetical protein
VLTPTYTVYIAHAPHSPQMAQIKTPAEVQLFRRNLESIDYEKLRKMLRHTMVKHFTAPELEYVVSMYATPLGRSVMAKMGAYTSEITPKLHEAMQPIMQTNAEFLVRACRGGRVAQGAWLDYQATLSSLDPD